MIGAGRRGSRHNPKELAFGKAQGRVSFLLKLFVTARPLPPLAALFVRGRAPLTATRWNLPVSRVWRRRDDHAHRRGERERAAESSAGNASRFRREVSPELEAVRSFERFKPSVGQIGPVGAGGFSSGGFGSGDGRGNGPRSGLD